MASAPIYSEALLLAQRPEVKGLAAELRTLCERYGDDAEEHRAENAGILAGSWHASPGTHIGHELIAAGLLIIAGPIDGDRLAEWVAKGERRAKTMWSA